MFKWLLDGWSNFGKAFFIQLIFIEEAPRIIEYRITKKKEYDISSSSTWGLALNKKKFPKKHVTRVHTCEKLFHL